MQRLMEKSGERAPSQAGRVACKEWPATTMSLQQQLLQSWQWWSLLGSRASEKMIRLAQVLQGFVVWLALQHAHC